MKPDALQIQAFLKRLSNEDWLKRTERRWWPRFVFHYTDIQNSVQILSEGSLYSREYLEANQSLPISSGSSKVLAGTNTSIKNCVRFYFRPQTPTQFYAEGIRSQAELEKSRYPDAHCPVPIFFLFDAEQILVQDDCFFSDGGLGSPKANILSTAAELQNLPWRKIYHTGAFNKANITESDISFRRNAEVIIPHHLSLKALQYIHCRSEAERETLLHLLPRRLQTLYQDKIVSTTRSLLFFRQHTFVEKVRLSSDLIYIHFSPDTKSVGPFHLKIIIDAGNIPMVLENPSFVLDKPYYYPVKTPVQNTSYRMRLYLDNHLVYANLYKDWEIPF